MNISEMIAELEALKEKNGDIQCGCIDQCGFIYPVESITFEDWQASGMDDKPFIFISEY